MVQLLTKYRVDSLGRYTGHVIKIRDLLNAEKIQEKIKDEDKRCI